MSYQLRFEFSSVIKLHICLRNIFTDLTGCYAEVIFVNLTNTHTCKQICDLFDKSLAQVRLINESVGRFIGHDIPVMY